MLNKQQKHKLILLPCASSGNSGWNPWILRGIQMGNVVWRPHTHLWRVINVSTLNWFFSLIFFEIRPSNTINGGSPTATTISLVGWLVLVDGCPRIEDGLARWPLSDRWCHYLGQLWSLQPPQSISIRYAKGVGVNEHWTATFGWIITILHSNKSMSRHQLLRCPNVKVDPTLATKGDKIGFRPRKMPSEGGDLVTTNGHEESLTSNCL